MTAIVGANDGDDKSNACVLLSQELETLLEPQFRSKSGDRVNDAEEVLRLRRQNDVTGEGDDVECGENLLGREGRLEKKVLQRIQKVQRHARDLAQERRVQERHYSQRPQKLVVPSAKDPVSMFDPSTWGMAFPELFPFGDGVPFVVRETRMSFLETIQYLLMRDELVYEVPGTDFYQASDRARWSSHVS